MSTSAPKLWPISVEGKWGFIDAHGSVRIEPQYAKASRFKEGLALVSVAGASEVDKAFNRAYDGFIDDSGEFVIPAQFPAFYPQLDASTFYGYSKFEDGVAIVRDATISSGLRGLIDRRGQLIAPMKYLSLGAFGEGLCSFGIFGRGGNSERGYMDYQGNVRLRPKGFLYGSCFAEGRAAITVRTSEGDHQVLIDRQGRTIVGPGEYTAISPVRGGLARVVKDGEVGLIDADGRNVVPIGEYRKIIEPERASTYIVEKNGVFYALDSRLEPEKLPDFGATPCGYRGDGIWIDTHDNKSGYAKPDGAVVVEPVYDYLDLFDGELCRFRKGTSRGYLNRSGQIVWSTTNWELPLRNSVRPPLQSYLPDFVLEAMPLSYNWDCENAIVFVCDGSLEMLRQYYVNRGADGVNVRDYTNYDIDPGKIDIRLLLEGGGYLEVYAAQGDLECEDAENTNGFVSFYHCKNMYDLRERRPCNTIGILIEN